MHSVNKINWPKKGSNPVVVHCVVSKVKYPINWQDKKIRYRKTTLVEATMLQSYNVQRSCAFDIIERTFKEIFSNFIDISYDISE